MTTLFEDTDAPAAEPTFGLAEYEEIRELLADSETDDVMRALGAGVTGAREPFCIDSEGRADWLLRKVAGIRAEKERVKAQADQITGRLDRQEQTLMKHFGPQLERWAQEELARRGSKGRALSLLQGSVSFRRVPGGLKIVDAKAALLYADRNALSCVLRNPTLDTADYREIAKRHLEETGELLPGVDTVPDRESMSLKFASAGKGGDSDG